MKKISTNYYNKNSVKYILGSCDNKLCFVDAINEKNRVKTKNR